jgi:hypothetical protein
MDYLAKECFLLLYKYNNYNNNNRWSLQHVSTWAGYHQVFLWRNKIRFSVLYLKGSCCPCDVCILDCVFCLVRLRRSWFVFSSVWVLCPTFVVVNISGHSAGLKSSCHPVLSLTHVPACWNTTLRNVHVSSINVKSRGTFEFMLNASPKAGDYTKCV